MKLRVKILDPRIGTEFPAPAYATPGSAAFDLVVCFRDQTWTKGVVRAGQTHLVPTGIAVEIPEGYVGLIYPRSGLGAKYGIVLGNGTGVIDSDYRGEILVSLYNRTNKDYVFSAGDRIAQMVVVPAPQFELDFVDELSTTKRADGGFGHSGK